MALSFSLPNLFGRGDVPLDDAQWLPAAESHAPAGPDASGFDLAVQARMRRERAQAERAGETPRLALGATPMGVGTRRLWSLFFLGVGLAFLSSAVLGLLGIIGFELGVLLVVALVIGAVITPIAAHRFLASFNPTLTLLADRDSFPPGEAVEIGWAFSRAPRSATNLNVVLQGEERATYRQGTSDTTATETFFEETLHEEVAGAGGLPLRGTFTLRIPEDANHSFASANNAIAWSLRAEAPVPRWPDISRTVPLRVWLGPEPTPAREEVA